MLPSTDLLICGAGPAGLSAAINAASEGLHVTVIDPGTIGGQARWSNAIENVAGFPHGIKGKDYGHRAYRQAKKFGARFLVDRGLTFCRLLDGTIAVQLDSMRMIEARALVLATGQTPRPLTVPGADRFGVFVGANPEDIIRYKGARVAIIGAGNSAGQAAQAFATIGACVVLYARRLLSDSMSTYLINRLRDRIDVRENEDVETIGRAPDNSLTIGADSYRAIFTFTGTRPDHTFPVICHEDGAIVAPQFRTNVPSVYAVGDVRADSAHRIATAVGEGSAVVALIHREVFV